MGKSVTHESINPDDASQSIFGVAISTRDSSRHSSWFRGTAVRAFQWRADRDYDSLVLRCHIFGAYDNLAGQVYYRMTIGPPGRSPSIIFSETLFPVTGDFTTKLIPIYCTFFCKIEPLHAESGML